MATQEIVRPEVTGHSAPPSAQSRRPDAGPIARAAIYHLRGDFHGALQCLVGIDPELETPDLLRARGYIQIELADFAAAEHSYAAAAEEDPTGVENWFQWGFCLHKLGEFAQALKAFERAASLGTDWIEVPLARSICHLGLKQYEQAIEHAETCLQIREDYVPALFTKAVALHLTWNLDQACETYSQVLDLDANATQARMNLITAAIQRKKFDLVQRQSHALLETDPNNLLAIEDLAVSAFSRED
ncbi:MAG: tetratricopeptide repeat protein, partial [Bryobacteraceae bacterium]